MWVTYLKRIAAALVAIVALISVIAVLLWRDRPSLDAIDWPAPSLSSAMNPVAVTVTCLGVTHTAF